MEAKKNLSEKLAEYLQMMEAAPFVYFTNIDQDGFPSTRAMLNLKNPNEYPGLAAIHKEEANPFTVFLTTNTSSRKFAQIKANNKASLYYCEPHRYHGLLLQGAVEIIADNELRQRAWQKSWEMYYPTGDSDYTLLRFVPVKLSSYPDFTVTTELLP